MKKTHCRAGEICGDPRVGLCERVVVEIPRVFDGCIKHGANENFVVKLDAMPSGTQPPFTFLCMRSDGNAAVSDVDIHRMCPKSRICAQVNIPVRCRFNDATGKEFAGYGAVAAQREVVLFVPDEICECRVKVKAAFRATNGAFINNDTVSASGCTVEEFEVVGCSRLLIPAYGEFCFPECCPKNPCCEVCLE